MNLTCLSLLEEDFLSLEHLVEQVRSVELFREPGDGDDDDDADEDVERL